MPEGESGEIARKLSEPRENDRESTKKERTRWEELVEIAEVAVLAIIAIATAWSGFQAAKWDGAQSVLYGTATKYRFQANAAATYGGQELSADASIFTAWLQATSAHDGKLAAIYVRRFTPDYRIAFLAWLKTDPLTNPRAPAGPGYMPQYHNPYLISAARFNDHAAAAFAHGNAARDNAERYLRDTVLFSIVLFLVAISQRFKVRGVRVTTIVVALGLLVFTAISVAQLPRA